MNTEKMKRVTYDEAALGTITWEDITEAMKQLRKQDLVDKLKR